MRRGYESSLRINLSNEDRSVLVSWQRSTKIPVGLARRGHIILLLASGEAITDISQIVGIARQHIYKWASRFNSYGVEGLYRAPYPGIRKYKNMEIKSALFSILHSPPSEYDINRTSWKLDDLKKCLSEKGIFVSKHVIRAIIKSAGYRWRKAKVVLTSNDPEYKEKLSQIKSILSNMKDDEFFFSVDEFGPFAIKMRGGKRIVAPDEYPYIPQIQKAKGTLIITAALELSQNQTAHFYSKDRNSTEMLRLLEILLKKYKDAKALYISWDSASWHDSRQLHKKVEELNSNDYKKRNGTPTIRLVPLPKSAQFLNVIESVFSGMAKAIIHNSNYQSVEEAIAAINRYFKERNEYFRLHPKKAGNKIWGNERVPSEFSESHNCKDPRW